MTNILTRHGPIIARTGTTEVTEQASSDEDGNVKMKMFGCVWCTVYNMTLFLLLPQSVIYSSWLIGYDWLAKSWD